MGTTISLPLAKPLRSRSIEDKSLLLSKEIVIQFKAVAQMTYTANKPYHVEYHELNGCHFNPIAEEFEEEDHVPEVIKCGKYIYRIKISKRFCRLTQLIFVCLFLFADPIRNSSLDRAGALCRYAEESAFSWDY